MVDELFILANRDNSRLLQSHLICDDMILYAQVSSLEPADNIWMYVKGAHHTHATSLKQQTTTTVALLGYREAYLHPR